MKHGLKVVSLLIIFSMLLSNVVLAANPDGVTFSATIDTPTINVSDEDQTVVVTIAVEDGTKIDLDGIGATVLCATDFKTSVSNTELTFTAGDYNANNGKFGWSHDFADTDYVTVNNIMVITYTIPANTPAGTYELGIEKLQITKDWGSDWEDGGVVTATLTIVDPNVPVEPTYVWTRVTNVSQLVTGDKVIIVAAGYDFALSTNQKSNNRGQAAVVKSGDTITFGDDVQILTLQAGNKEGTYAFYTGESGYLYAASSSSNYLRTEKTLSDNSSWSIAIAADGTATVVAQGANKRNVMQYNQTSSLFACYSSASQKAIQIYKQVEVVEDCTHANKEHVEYKAPTCTTEGNIEYWSCPDCYKIFSNADCTTEVTDVVLPTAHDFTGTDPRICTVCGIYKDGSTLTIDEVLAYGATLAAGATTEYKYYVTGEITEVYDTTYGNMYITDGTNTLTIYGLYKDGVRYDKMETKPVVNDTIKVYGAIQNYKGTTIEIVNAELIEHTVPECEHEDGDDADHNCDKCDYPNVSEHSYTEIREGTWKCACGWYKEDSTLTIPEALEFAQLAGSAYTTGKYYITGVITEIKSTTYGNMYITDGTNSIYIYGTSGFGDMDPQPAVGDTVVVYGTLGTYNNAAQMKGAIYELTPHTCVDENSDHICDNGCDVYQGTHADGTDADHLCDYCQGVVVGENCAAHLTHVPEQYDKCEGGYKEYWTCSCGKYYEDDAATKEITDLSAWKAEGGAGYLKPEHYPSYLIFAETHQLACCVCSARLAAPEPHDYTTGTSAHTCICGDKFTGWDGKVYYENAVMLTGWAEIDGAWYYLDPTTGVRAEGLTRVPYNTALGHDANADDKAYWEANKETSKYTDATTAVYVFGEDGKLNRTTGIVGGNRYAVDGVIAWHVGLVEVEGEYYYFGGDVNGNGNIMMTGKVYVTRNTTDLETVNGGIYTFGEDGKLCKYDGITDIDGTLYYYEDYRLAIEAGLVKFDGDYYYVRSNGQLVVGRDYWVANTNGYLAAGMYTFGADGKIVMGTESEELDGIVDIDGVLYYYKGGVKQVGAGVVKLVDDNGETFYIYVRSNGQLATGIYWPTTRNGYLDRGAYDWGTDGRYYPAED